MYGSRLLYQSAWFVAARPDSDCSRRTAGILPEHAACHTCEAFRSYLGSPVHETGPIERKAIES